MVYTPPGKRLFQARHRVSRRDLQEETLKETDWTTVQDVEMNGFIYAVPVIDVAERALPHKGNQLLQRPPQRGPQQQGSQQQPQQQGRQLAESPMSSASSIFSVPGVREIGDRYSNGTVDSLVEGLDPVLKYNMQRNISVDSLIQENNKRMSEHRDSLALLREYDAQSGGGGGAEMLETEARRELRKLRYENRTLLQREDALTKLWQEVRDCSDDGALLITLRKRNLYWFGIPADLTQKVYKICLYSDCRRPPPLPLANQVLQKLLGDRVLGMQVLANINKELPWLFDSRNETAGTDANAAVLETNLYGQFPGLYYHLKDKLQVNILEQFMKPLLRTTTLRILNRNQGGLELLDILVVSLHYHELENVLLAQMLPAILEQCHFKFFHGTLAALINEMNTADLDVYRLLESLRKPHTDTLGPL